MRARKSAAVGVVVVVVVVVVWGAGLGPVKRNEGGAVPTLSLLVPSFTAARAPGSAPPECATA